MNLSWFGTDERNEKINFATPHNQPNKPFAEWMAELNAEEKSLEEARLVRMPFIRRP